MRRRFEPGDKLILVTDGVTEAMNAAKEEFGEQRFVAVIDTGPQEPPRDLVSRSLPPLTPSHRVRSSRTTSAARRSSEKRR